jgi:hypothetical protein
MSKRPVGIGVALGVVAVAFACTIRDITEVPVGSVVVQPSSVTVLEGETQQFTAQAKDAQGRNLPSEAVIWSSDAPTVFSIDAKGNGQALTVGQATVWATLDGTRGSGSIRVDPRPSIVVDADSLLFFGDIDGTPPDPRIIHITNGGGGRIGGLSVSPEYSATGMTGWLSLALNGTTAPSSLTVSILLRSLKEGSHEATIVLSSIDAQNSPVRIPVQAVLKLSQPVISLTPTQLEFTAEVGGATPVPQTVQVTNGGGSVLSDLEISTWYVGAGGWLSASLTTDIAPAELLAQVDPAGLSPGLYSGEIQVRSARAMNSPQTVAVTLSIIAGSAHQTTGGPKSLRRTPAAK